MELVEQSHSYTSMENQFNEYSPPLLFLGGGIQKVNQAAAVTAHATEVHC